MKQMIHILIFKPTPWKETWNKWYIFWYFNQPLEGDNVSFVSGLLPRGWFKYQNMYHLFHVSFQGLVKISEYVSFVSGLLPRVGLNIRISIICFMSPSKGWYKYQWNKWYIFWYLNQPLEGGLKQMIHILIFKPTLGRRPETNDTYSDI